MKNDLFAFIGATAAFISVGIITYKLLNRRYTSGSFRELYEDNADKNSDPDNIYTNGEADDMYADFVYMPW